MLSSALPAEEARRAAEVVGDRSRRGEQDQFHAAAEASSLPGTPRAQLNARLQQEADRRTTRPYPCRAERAHAPVDRPAVAQLASGASGSGPSGSLSLAEGGKDERD